MNLSYVPRDAFVCLCVVLEPFVVSWTELDTGVFVLPETALGSYSLRLECVESASKRFDGSSYLSPYPKMPKIVQLLGSCWLPRVEALWAPLSQSPAIVAVPFHI